jgi:hypothetical protein
LSLGPRFRVETNATVRQPRGALFGAQMIVMLFAKWQIDESTHLPSEGKTAW